MSLVSCFLRLECCFGFKSLLTTIQSKAEHFRCSQTFSTQILIKHKTNFLLLFFREKSTRNLVHAVLQKWNIRKLIEIKLEAE